MIREVDLIEDCCCVLGTCWGLAISDVSCPCCSVTSLVFKSHVDNKYIMDRQCVFIAVMFTNSMGAHPHAKSCILVCFAELPQVGIEVSTHKQLSSSWK